MLGTSEQPVSPFFIVHMLPIHTPLNAAEDDAFTETASPFDAGMTHHPVAASAPPLVNLE